MKLILPSILIICLVFVAYACENRIYPVPLALHDGKLHLISATPESMHEFCRLKGYHRAGSKREFLAEQHPTLPTVDALERRPCNKCSALRGIECIPKGGKACKPDAKGNIGTDNIGRGNFGSHNIGDWNIGNYNEGGDNLGCLNHGGGLVGGSNHGDFVRNGCFVHEIATCPLSAFKTFKACLDDELVVVKKKKTELPPKKKKKNGGGGGGGGGGALKSNNNGSKPSVQVVNPPASNWIKYIWTVVSASTGQREIFITVELVLFHSMIKKRFGIIGSKAMNFMITTTAVSSDGKKWTSGKALIKVAGTPNIPNKPSSPKPPNGEEETEEEFDPCSDKKLNGDETDVDCGGSCSTKCTNGKKCVLNGDCISTFCDPSTKVCLPPPTCSDNKLNGDETDVDCGGSCSAKCVDTQGCLANSDCVNGDCDANNVCISCSDNLKTGDETDVDCGGSCSAKCADTKKCLADTDCESSVCDPTNKVCLAPTCSDNAVNGDETDVDCGGPTCSACADTQECLISADCVNGDCDANNICISCSDNLKTGDETDVDCGGAVCSAKCVDTQGCLANSDCLNGDCDANNVCISCSDNLKTGDETDVDCGGSCSAKCADTKKCLADTDCESSVCDPTNKVCLAPTCSDGVLNGNETDVDCGGDTCNNCENNKTCLQSSDCRNGLCDNRVCATWTPSSTSVFSSNFIYNGGFEAGVRIRYDESPAPLVKTPGWTVPPNKLNWLTPYTGDGAAFRPDPPSTLTAPPYNGGGNTYSYAVNEDNPSGTTSALLTSDPFTVLLGTRLVTSVDFYRPNNGAERVMGLNIYLQPVGNLDPTKRIPLVKMISDKKPDGSIEPNYQLATVNVWTQLAAEFSIPGTGSAVYELKADLQGFGYSSSNISSGDAGQDFYIGRIYVGQDLADSATCSTDNDCTGSPANWCDTSLTTPKCSLRTCWDGAANGDETDVDCGGSSGCNACEDGKQCLVDSDCRSQHCNSSKVCAAWTAPAGATFTTNIILNGNFQNGGGVAYDQPNAHLSQPTSWTVPLTMTKLWTPPNAPGKPNVFDNTLTNLPYPTGNDGYALGVYESTSFGTANRMVTSNPMTVPLGTKLTFSMDAHVRSGGQRRMAVHVYLQPVGNSVEANKIYLVKVVSGDRPDTKIPYELGYRPAAYNSWRQFASEITLPGSGTATYELAVDTFGLYYTSVQKDYNNGTTDNMVCARFYLGSY